MKKFFLTFLLTLLIITNYPQSVMLGVHKTRVKLEMSFCSEYNNTVSEKSYLEYQKGDTTISYTFKYWMGGWYCNEVAYKIPDSSAIEMIYIKEKTGCWVYYGYDVWLYETDEINVPLWVKMTQSNGFTTFTYKF